MSYNPIPPTTPPTTTTPPSPARRASDNPDEPSITITIRSLLDQTRQEQTAGFATIAARFDMMATKEDVARLSTNLDHMNARMTDIENWRRSEEVKARVLAETVASKVGNRQAHINFLLLGASVLAVIVAAVITVVFA